MQKRLGIIRHAYTSPLYVGWEHGTGESSQRFTLVQDAAPRLVQKLLQGELDGAFVSPIEYAKNSSRLRIVQGLCVASLEANHTIEMHFRDDLKTIGAVAVNPEFTSETVLAKILLSEKYDVTPRFVAVPQIFPGVLAKADAALVVGDDCSQWEDHENFIDLVEEWIDSTDLPFVQGFWVTKEESLTSEEIGYLYTGLAPEETQPIEFTFRMDESVIAGLQEFLKMCYYHGVLQEVPELQFTEQSDS